MIKDVIDAQYQVLPWSHRLEKEALYLLNNHKETSLFLLSNILEYGTKIGDSYYSGNYKCIVDNKNVKAVFCLGRNGNLLLQTDRSYDFSPLILDACQKENIEIGGCLGDWDLATNFWKTYNDHQPKADIATQLKEVLYALQIKVDNIPRNHMTVRFLNTNDFDVWEPLNVNFFEELGIPVPGTLKERRDTFMLKVSQKHWWGLFEDNIVIGTVGFNACVDEVAQIGGVYILPKYRRMGLARYLITSILRDVKEVHGIDRLMLFTEKDNMPARLLYEKLGFDHIGHFGLLFWNNNKN